MRKKICVSLAALSAALMMTGCGMPAVGSVSDVLDAVKAELPFGNKEADDGAVSMDNGVDDTAPEENGAEEEKAVLSEVPDIVDEKTGQHAMADADGNYHLNGYRLLRIGRSEMPATAVVGAVPTVDVYTEIVPEEDTDDELTEDMIEAQTANPVEKVDNTSFMDSVNKAIDEKKSENSNKKEAEESAPAADEKETDSSNSDDTMNGMFKKGTVKTAEER